MSSYSSPSEAFVEAVTGISAEALGITSGAMTTLFGQLLAPAEASVALTCGESRFDSTSLTARQVTNLQQAVAYQVAVYYLQRAATERAEGTNAPLLSDEAALEGKIADYRAEAQR